MGIQEKPFRITLVACKSARLLIPCAAVCLWGFITLNHESVSQAQNPSSISEQPHRPRRLPPIEHTSPTQRLLIGAVSNPNLQPSTRNVENNHDTEPASKDAVPETFLPSPTENLNFRTTLLAPNTLPTQGSRTSFSTMAEEKFQIPFWIDRSSQVSAQTARSSRRQTPRFSTSSNHSTASESQETVDLLTDRVAGPPESIPEGTVEQFSERESCESNQLFYGDFSPTPLINSSLYHDGQREQWVYDNRYAVPTQHPWVEWGRIFYGDGITPRGKNWFGFMNLARPEFYMYGDFRSGILAGRNAAGRSDNWANRLNLDMDLKLTDTEHLHAFIGPIENEGQFTRLELVEGELQYRQEVDITPFTGYFEGDMGSILGGLTGQSSPFEFPFTVGLIPLFFQNGIWMEDAVTGAAFSLPARHSNLLNWSNYDATFFAVFDQLNSPAFGNNVHAAQAFGTAWFIEAYHGYIESGYAYIRDRNQPDLSYHNMTASYTRRYFDRISNSIRVIINTGQDLPKADRTADGVLLLVENSWITASPLTFVPYANFFAGWNRPQSIARAGIAGGILRNTGINFDTDGVNGLATLDASGSDTAGGSIGVDLLGSDLDKQLLLEASYLTPHGNGNAAVKGDQYALGLRFQIPLSNATLWRFDTMYGWRGGLDDVYGTRMEYRWKF